MTDGTTITNNLLQVLLSNGFPRLRICKVFDIGDVRFSDTWTGSSTLHTLNLFLSGNFFIKDPTPQELILSICPRLRQLTTNRFPMDGFEGNALAQTALLFSRMLEILNFLRILRILRPITYRESL